MSLLNVYGRVSISLTDEESHMSFINDDHIGHVRFMTPNQFHDQLIDDEYFVEETETLTSDINETEDLINSRVIISINDDAITLQAFVDPNTSNGERLLRWILSFQVSFKRRWIFDLKRYHQFEYSCDDHSVIDEWTCSYFEMVGHSCGIDAHHVWIEYEPGSAKDINFHRWIEHGRDLGIAVSEIVSNEIPIHVSMPITNLDPTMAIINDLLIDYGYEWLARIQPTIDGPLIQIMDDWKLIRIMNGTTSLTYRWIDDTYESDGSWIKSYRFIRQLIRDGNMDALALFRS